MEKTVFKIFNPANGKLLKEVLEDSSSEIDQKAKAARIAQSGQALQSLFKND